MRPLHPLYHERSQRHFTDEEEAWWQGMYAALRGGDYGWGAPGRGAQGWVLENDRLRLCYWFGYAEGRG